MFERLFALMGTLITAICFSNGVLAVTLENSRWWSIGCFFIGISMLRFFNVLSSERRECDECDEPEEF